MPVARFPLLAKKSEFGGSGPLKTPVLTCLGAVREPRGYGNLRVRTVFLVVGLKTRLLAEEKLGEGLPT